MASSDAIMAGGRTLPPVLGRLQSAMFWLVLQVPLQILFSFWSLRLIVEAIGPEQSGAYRFAFGLGFFQLLFEFGAGSALQRQISDAWARGDGAGIRRAIAAGMNFYAATALVQAAALLGVAYLAVPYAHFAGSSSRLVVRLLWIQAVTAPGFGIAVVVSSVLQAARRYDFVPRYELAITVSRFVVLVLGLRGGVDFIWIVVVQTGVTLGLRIGPALWVMVRELGYVLHFHGAGWADYKVLGHFSFYMALIQFSVVLADKVDTTILGFVLSEPGPNIAAYDVVNKAFLLLRQSGGMLASLVMPAVASLAAARDERGLERVKYDGSRLYIGVFLPVGLLAWIFSGPFLSLWFGRRLGYDAGELAPLMRLFLVATIPLTLSIPVQMSIGMNKIKVIALAALAGSLINLPISCYLATRLGVAGVIWGTVLTTLFSNLLVPGVYVFHVLEIELLTFLKRTLGPPLTGGAALIVVSWVLRSMMPVTSPGTSLQVDAALLILHLGVGVLAYLGGYLLVPAARGDLAELVAMLRRR
jgi:O-antigen/teichoic acid export membrane protein